MPETENDSELEKPRWSVISFDRCEVSGLTYEQATAKLADLETRKISGLCVITDEAAARLNP